MTESLLAQLHRELTPDSGLRMTYLGDGISTDDENPGEDGEGNEGATYTPPPTEEGAPEGEEPPESSEEA